MKDFLKLIDLKMMVVMILFCTSTLSISAQEWNWAKSFGQPDTNSMISGMSKLSNNDIAVLSYTPNASIFAVSGSNLFISIIDKEGNLKKDIKIIGSEK